MLVSGISPVFATNVIELDSHCDIFDCWTTLEITQLKPEDITLYKNNLGNFITKKEAFTLDKTMTKPIQNTIEIKSVEWDTKNPDIVNISGSIGGATNNYWGILGIYNSSWWNSSFPYCKNISVTDGSKDFPAFIQVSHEPPYMNDSFKDVRFINTTCNNNGGKLSHFLRNKSDLGWADYDLLLDGSQNISIYYGNVNATSDSDLEDVWGNNLVAYYIMDECTGSTVKDVANGLNGFSNATWVNDGRVKYGCALSFNDLQVVQVSDNNLLDLTEMTFTAWINLSSVETYNSWVGKRGASSNYQCGLDASVRLTFYSSESDTSSSGDFTANSLNWAGITMSDNSGDLEFYKNGVKVDDDAGNSIAGTNSDNLTIGASYSVDKTDYWNGIIDELMIFNDTISEGQIGKWYEETEPTFYFEGEEEMPEEEPEPIINLTEATYVSWSCVLNNSVKNVSVTANNTTTETLTVDICSNGCNEENLLIGGTMLTTSLCNPPFWLQAILVIFVIIGLYWLYRWVA